MIEVDYFLKSREKNKFQSPQEDGGPSGGWESMRATDYRRRRAPRAAVTASKWEVGAVNPCGETPLKAITQRLPPLNPQPELQIQPELRTHKTHLTGIYQSLALSATLLLTIVL